MSKASAHKWSAADTVTALRLALTLPLLFIPPASVGFLIVYTLAGLTDVLDGFLARKSGTASDFGARLDSVADLLFYTVMMLRCFPLLFRSLPHCIWLAVGAVLLLRAAAYITAAVKYHRFASLHTWLNKLTGAAVFLVPYSLALSFEHVCGWGACVLAFTASLEELLIHLLHSDYSPACKSVLATFKVASRRGN